MQQIFVNIPVRSLHAAEAFYVALGAVKNPKFSDGETFAMELSDAIIVMIMTRERYATFTRRPIGNAARESQLLIALTVADKIDVNTILERAVAAGGKADPNPPQDHGFMCSRSVEDPDGYVWELVWMDASTVAAY